jgi:haloalkane dehalogenase
VTGSFIDAPVLPDWLAEEMPFDRRSFTASGHTVHFIDAGNGPVVLLQHGNPTWCYLWRKVIPLLLKEGVRVIAPDLVGLGFSDKPRDPRVHSLDFHGEMILRLIEASGIERMTVVGQDWGGPIVGVVAARAPARVTGAVFANTGLRVPKRQPRVTPFHRFSNIPLISNLVFRAFCFPVPVMHKVQGDPRTIGKKERRAYRYPLRAWGDRVAPLAFARLVPTNLDHPTVKSLGPVERWARSFEGPVRLVWGMRDPILGRSIRSARELFPDAQVTETQAGHFLQEEVPEVLAEKIVEVVREAT